MAYKIAIDANKGGSDSGSTGNGLVEKNYTLEISKYINNRLKELGIENYLIRDSDVNLSNEDRVNSVKNKYGTGNNIIVISNRITGANESGSEIIYPLRSNSKLASLISDSLNDAGANVIKYYQLRNSNDTSLDDDYLIRNTPNNQTIVIDYGNLNNLTDANLIKNNYEKLAEGVVKALAEYSGINYVPISGNYYIVQKGDSLWSIASKNNTTINILKSLNKLTSNTLSIGQLLKLPEKEGNNENTNNIANTYTVQKGDSLWVIANKYNTTVDKIKSTNNLTNNTLSIGQVLVIPGNNEENKITYIVQKGDSLWLIANKYDTTVDKIKSTNNLTSNTLSIGQVIIIPSSSSYITYIVKSGDSLYSISKKYNTTVDNIKKLNNLTSNTLSIGQKLLINS